ncbi:MAG: hypothetical protein K9I69_03225 [Ignavibacteriales bacterium]|nr:hypothetical protein [Ignavibacteriales bacterium]MCF8306314.1 hypothetical protein [Ignavibacteriales bacterium]MCF8316035.1 hypothetical protein [Ignavibacteriales bacterium]
MTLKNNVNHENIGFVESFPHECLLADGVTLKFTYYSEIHFKLIKHLGISNEGRLQKINHEIYSVKENIRKDRGAFNSNQTELITKLEELSLFQQWTGTNIAEELETAKKSESKDDLISVAEHIDEIIYEIDLKLSLVDNNNRAKTIKKSNYKVFIIEDNTEHRNLLYEMFSEFYNEVFPDISDHSTDIKIRKDFSISEAEEIIREMAKDYNIFLIDLLYKDSDGHWLNFNGLDLYRLVKSVNPYAVRRIITSLPRRIVAKLVEVIATDTEKPNIDHVFTKKYGNDYLRDTVIESIEKINEECCSKAKTKTVLSPFPKKGIFGWPGISEYLLQLLSNDNGLFEKCYSSANDFFSKFLKGTLEVETLNWKGGKLPAPKMKKSIDDSYFLEKLPIILTHRLIALEEAIKSPAFLINLSDYSSKTGRIRSSRGDLDKGYFQTKLGFEGSEIQDGGIPVEFKISLKNLFPHEIKIITKNLSQINAQNFNSRLADINPFLDEWFKGILIKPDIYKNWEILKLDFNPYQEQLGALDTGENIQSKKFFPFTVSQLTAFLQALLDHYTNPRIQTIATLVSDNPPDENRIKNQTIEILINSLYPD